MTAKSKSVILGTTLRTALKLTVESMFFHAYCNLEKKNYVSKSEKSEIYVFSRVKLVNSLEKKISAGFCHMAGSQSIGRKH